MRRRQLQAGAGRYALRAVSFMGAFLKALGVLMIVGALLVPQATAVRVGPNIAVADAPDAQNEPSIAVNPTNENNLVAGANDYRLWEVSETVWAGVYTSFDGGGTWAEDLMPGYPGGPTSVLSGYDAAGDPSLAFDASGVAHYAGIAFNWTGVGGAVDGTIWHGRSEDGGLTWTQTIVARGGKGIFHDHEQIAADRWAESPHGNNIYVSWTMFVGFGKSPIVVSRSTDGGRTWSAPLEVSGTVTPGGFFQDSLPAVGPDGTVYVVWDETFTLQGGTTAMRLWIARSGDGGATFSAPMLVQDVVPEVLHNAEYRHGTYPAMAVAPDGKVYVAWADNRFGDADILLTTSSDKGRTWSAPVRVNDDPVGGGTDQFFPWVSISPKGRVDIMWYDKRPDPNNYLLDVFYANTRDGRRISANVRVTDVSSDPAVWPAFLGDYNGMASTEKVVYPVWTDMRNGEADPRDFNQDIYTALVMP
jgi:hypothetical protein